MLALDGVAACGEDEDGGTTDEEIPEGEDRVNDIGDKVQDEVDAQDQARTRTASRPSRGWCEPADGQHHPAAEHVIVTDPVDVAVSGKDRDMAVAMTRTSTSPCRGCGKLVDGDAAFCSVCGTRQIPDRPMPVRVTPGETERLARSTNAWMLAVLAAMAMLLVGVGMVAGTVSATMTGDVSGDGADADAAETMDAYAPYAEEWAEKHDHVADEASGDDANGLATAAADARLWIGTYRGDLGALAASAEGGSALLYEELVGIFDQRAAVLAAIEATATAGGDGEAAAADDVAALEALDQRADATTCEIVDVMRAEGDDPDEHVTPGMGISC